MPEDTGSILVKVVADISDLKKGLKEVVQEIQNLKGAADKNTSLLGNMGQEIAAIGSGLMGITSSMLNMFGATMSVYGAYVLLRNVTEHWYNLIKSGVEQVDEYRRAIYSTSGLMTAISKIGPGTPDLQTAYGQWKEYFDWLYRTSLETSRKVSASGKEIFQAGMELAMRGLVPKTSDQVFVTGQLVDFIKSVTKGLSEQQQLYQEIRSMFEGQMRLGAQALQKFVQIDPKFREKFAEARQAAMAMGDATPIWELLKKTMEGTRYASADLATTWTSLYNTGKTVFQMLMMEAFGPAYDSIVKMGWSLIDIIYQNGQLTESGKLLASSLSNAWNMVREKVQEYITYAINNAPVLAERVGDIANALGLVAKATITAAGAFVSLANAISELQKYQGVLILIATLLGFAAGGAVGALVGAAGSAAAIMLASGKAKTDEEIKAQEEFVGGYKEPEGAKQSYLERTAEAGMTLHGADTGEAATDAKEAKLKNLNDRTEQLVKYRTEENKQLLRSGQILKDSTNKYEERAKKQAEYEIQKEKGISNAPAVPKVNISQPDDKKKAGAQKKPDVKEQTADIALARADREYKIAQAEADFKKLKSADALRFAQLKEQLEEGKISWKKYYDDIRDMDLNEARMSIEILKQKKDAAIAAQDAIIAAIDEKKAKGNIDEATANIQKMVELAKRKTIEVKAQSEIDSEIAKKEKQVYDTNRKQAHEEEKYGLEKLKIQKSTSWGPLAQEQAAVDLMREQYAEKAKGHPEDAAFWKEQGDLKEMEIRYKTEIDGFVNAIKGGIDDLINGLMEGKADLSAIMNKMFTSIFKSSLEQGMKELTQKLTDAFRSMFKDLGPGIASAAMGAIALVGMLVTKKSSSSFSASGVQSKVTSHEAVRGVIAGDTSLPIAQISTSLQEALVSTNSILSQIERNTRNINSLHLDLTVDIPGLKDAVAGAMDKYFQQMAQTMMK
jgi:hypothetical protein